MPRTFEGNLVSPKGRFAITVSRFNSFITDPLLAGALDTLVRHGVADGDIDVYRCPGTWELSGPHPPGGHLRQVRRRDRPGLRHPRGHAALRVRLGRGGQGHRPASR